MRTKDMKGLMEAISSVMTPQVAIDEARQMKDPKKEDGIITITIILGMIAITLVVWMQIQ